jgi:DNA polymerase phi
MPGMKRAHDSDVAVTAEAIHPSRKRRLDYSQADAQLAKIYNDLADDVQAVRIKAAGEVVRNLSVKSDHQIERIEKAIARLIKGLCSSRKAARLGFSIALSEVLRLALDLKDSGITLAKLTAKVAEFTTAHVTAGGQERRDYLIGRRFAYQAVLQSGVGSNGAISSQEWQDFVAAVMALMCEKQWLRRECGAMLYEYLVGVGKGLPSDRLQTIVDALHENSLWKTPEGVAIWLTLTKSSTKVKLPKGVWQHNDPLSANERVTLSKVVQEIPIDDEQQGGKAGSGSRQTAPSFAWPVLLAELYGGSRSAKDFTQFWTSVVESGLFHTSSSAERKALGFQVLAMAITSAPSPLLRQLFTPNLTRCIINQRAGAQRYLFDAAKAALNSAVARSKQDPSAASGLIQGLIEEGAPNFDQATKTKTIDTLLGQASPEALASVVIFIQKLMRKPNVKHGEQAQADAQRRMLADLLLSIVRTHKEPSDLFVKHDSKQKNATPSTWLNTVLDTLIELGYCEPSESDEVSPALSDASKSICRSRLSSCVAQLMNLPLADASTAVYGLLKALRSSKRSHFQLSASKEAKALVKRTDKAIQDAQEKVAKTKNQSKAATAQAFALLFAMSVFQIYNEEPDAIPVLEDLHACAGDWGKDTESASVLIELLLSFVSKQSALFRKLAEQVFSAFTGSLNADGLQSMLDILTQKESLSGQQELFAQGEDGDGAGEEEDSDDGSAIDVEDMSDVEMVDGEAVGVHGSNESGSDDDDEDSDDESSGDDDDDDNDEADEEDEEELAAFDKKLAEALGTAGFDMDADEDDQDSDMDDEQMLAVEPALEKVFKEIKKRSGKKQDNKDAKDNIVNFKNRVLDLLSIYVKAQHSNILALDILMPLAILIRTTSSKPVAEKAFAVLKNYFDACNKHKSTPAVSESEPILALLASVHEEMAKDGSKLHANACSRSSLFLAKVLVAMDPKHYSAVATMYAALQEKWWLDPKSKVHGSVFTEWTSWSIATRKQA